MGEPGVVSEAWYLERGRETYEVGGYADWVGQAWGAGVEVGGLWVVSSAVWRRGQEGLPGAGDPERGGGVPT